MKRLVGFSIILAFGPFTPMAPAALAQPKPANSNMCVTPVVTCYLTVSAPPGTACWCATPTGPVSGKVA